MSEDNLPAPGQQLSTEPDPGNRRGPRITAALLAGSLLLGACSSPEEPEPGAAKQTSYTSAEATNSTALPESTAPSIESPNPTDYATAFPEEVSGSDTVIVTPNQNNASASETISGDLTEHYLNKITDGQASEQSVALFKDLYGPNTGQETINTAATYYERIHTLLSVLSGQTELTDSDVASIRNELSGRQEQAQNQPEYSQRYIELEDALINSEGLPLEDYIKYVEDKYPNVSIVTEFNNDLIISPGADANSTKPLGAEINSEAAKIDVLGIARALESFPLPLSGIKFEFRLGDVQWPSNGGEAPGLTLKAADGTIVIDLDATDASFESNMSDVVKEEGWHAWEQENPIDAGNLMGLIEASLPEGLELSAETPQRFGVGNEAKSVKIGGQEYCTLEGIPYLKEEVTPVGVTPYSLLNGREALAALGVVISNPKDNHGKLANLDDPRVNSNIIEQQLAGFFEIIERYNGAQKAGVVFNNMVGEIITQY